MAPVKEHTIQQEKSIRRQPVRILWANAFCLLDTSSGASMAVRQMLLQLKKQGVEIRIIGASNFDHERGTAGLEALWPSLKQQAGRFVTLADGPLEHLTFVTKSTHRQDMTCKEEAHWFGRYRRILAEFKPDILFYFGGKPLDFLIANEARSQGCTVAFYMANGRYTQDRWCRDVDLVITDSKATADLYKKRLGLDLVPVGPFIDPAEVRARHHTRKRVLFINPLLSKGAGIVARLAMGMAQRRPDIVFEVVQARGTWEEILKWASGSISTPVRTLDNVVVTDHTRDMRPVYGRARLLLAPSLGWESAGRVLVEAMINGIPPVVTQCGGMPEIVKNAGIVWQLPPVFHEKPYLRIPSDVQLEPLISCIETLYDNQEKYETLSALALHVAQTHHSLETSTRRLIQALGVI
ncbi:MAG: glycosyltransferase family 4 protein [Desulfobacterium sp.]|nr:glycosyltransferase family 4 protein [Desulfobacterium sp.]